VSSLSVESPRRSATLDLQIDVTDAVALGEPLHQHARVFVPTPEVLARHTRPPVLLCQSGSTYDKGYWHLEVPDHPGYSFAEHMAAAGCIVVALDHLSVGESSLPKDGDSIHLSTLAMGAAHVAAWVRAAASTGSLVPGLAPIPDVRLIGVGHSMGSGVTLMAQAQSRPYDALALLGYTLWGTGGADDSGQDDHSEPVSDTLQLLAQSSDGSYLRPRRADLHALFHLEDVPAAVIAADDESATAVPRWCVAECTELSSIQALARQIDVPLLIGLGDHDVSAHPRQEPAAFSACDDITLVILPGSAHCHNFAGTRHLLWNRLAGWIAGLPD
jgi:alpha-beta hydrolase superfamily lysophospholipase